MSVWSRIVALAAKAFEEPEPPAKPAAKAAAKGEDCSADIDDLGFTTAVIGLAAKMARADGTVSSAEVCAAAAVFRPPPGEEDNFRRVFQLAQQTVLGFDSYARQIGKRYRDRPCLLEDVLDGLFHIARADGRLGAEEDRYLAAVAEAFGFSDGEYRRIRASHLGEADKDPFAVLGVNRDASLEDAQRAWRRLVQENHPDRLIARGAPQAFIDIAKDKTSAINAAFAAIRARAARIEGAPSG